MNLERPYLNNKCRPASVSPSLFSPRYPPLPATRRLSSLPALQPVYIIHRRHPPSSELATMRRVCGLTSSSFASSTRHYAREMHVGAPGGRPRTSSQAAPTTRSLNSQQRPRQRGESAAHIELGQDQDADQDPCSTSTRLPGNTDSATPAGRQTAESAVADGDRGQ